MTRLLNSKKRTFTGCYESLEKIRDFVVPYAKKMGFDEKAAYAIELAVDEACTNIIEHAYGGEDRGKIYILLEQANNELRIKLEDFGKPFDLNIIPEPQVDLPIEKLKMRGLGIYLMRKMMDEVIYRTDPKNGNEFTLIKRI